MTLKKIVPAVFIGFVVILSLAYGLFMVSKSRTFQFFGEIIDRVETNKKLVALTFDDAPGEYSDEVLKILKEHEIPATFYAVGKSIEENPDAMKRIVAEGHQIGNHSYSHTRMMLITPGFVKEEIEKTDELIKSAGYTQSTDFRPPYGKKLFALPYYLASQNKKTIMWDVEPESYPVVMVSKDTLVSYTVENTKPGSILLLHPFNQNSISREALPEIITQLKKQGYTFVTVNQLLSLAH